MPQPVRLRNTFAEVDLAKLKHNFLALRTWNGDGNFFCPMVKADGYGHGEIEVSKVMEGCGAIDLGVSLVEEGVRLRQGGVRVPILTFAFFDDSGGEEIIRYSLTPVLSSWDQIEQLKKHVAAGRKFPVHIKFNTGMSRLGFDTHEAEALKIFFNNHDQFQVDGICTHLLNGEDAPLSNGRTQEQLQLFQTVEKHFSTPSFGHLWRHVHNSAALMQQKIPSIYGSRPGIAIYGVWPEIAPHTGVQLLPVMQLKASLALVRNVEVGETVSYSGRWRAQRKSVIGVVPIGYADGYSRFFSNKGVMLFRGKRVPVTGNVCMDYTMIDLTDVVSEGAPKVGEEVVIFGEQKQAFLGVDELARLMGTISYEILTCLGKRIPRVYING